MNILDYSPEDCNVEITKAIFDKMKDLVSYYKEFEVSIKNLSLPIDIDTFEGQQAIKDFLEIRVVEELMEMREAIVEKDRIDHIHEEIADALNFLIASYIIYGWDETKFESIGDIYKPSPEKKIVPEEIDKLTLDIVYQIGIACNKLKIRPWKKSQYLTDMLVFEERFTEIFYKFFNLVFRGLNLTPGELWSLFSRKNQCNMFRINTGY